MKNFRVEIVHTEAETNKKLKLTVMIFFSSEIQLNSNLLLLLLYGKSHTVHFDIHTTNNHSNKQHQHSLIPIIHQFTPLIPTTGLFFKMGGFPTVY